MMQFEGPINIATPALLLALEAIRSICGSEINARLHVPECWLHNMTRG